jgi:8-oxo-dGTP pyrophosphatase MutT (NUDIX family)
MYKVFIENRAVEFVNSQNIDLNLPGIDARFVLSIEADLTEYLINLDSNACFYIHCQDPRKEWERLFRNHQFVHAAGGAVQKDQEFLLIRRFGMLDLPKGHLDLNERPEIAAEREIREECGISPLIRRYFICTTYHTYFYMNHPVLKQTDWYLFDYHGTDKGQPQTEEGIEEVIWMTFPEIKLLSNEFYTSVQHVLAETEKKIGDQSL